MLRHLLRKRKIKISSKIPQIIKIVYLQPGTISFGLCNIGQEIVYLITIKTAFGYLANSKKMLMYYYRAIWKYWCDINMYNFTFCLFMSLIVGFGWGVFMFSTIGILIGRQCFKVFKNDEYYLYHNLGFSKPTLLIIVFLINLMFVFPIALFLLIFKFLDS